MLKSNVVTGILAVVLGIGTVLGVFQALHDKGHDRAAPANTAPVYGTP